MTQSTHETRPTPGTLSPDVGDAHSSVPCGVFARLAADNAELVSLFARTQVAPDPEAKQTLWTELRRSLLSHERAKSHELYRVCDEYPSLLVYSEEATHQNRVIESLVRDLSSLAFDSAEWRTTFEDLRDKVQSHIEREEAEVFPRAQAAMGTDRAEVLELAYISARRSEAQGFTQRAKNLAADY